MCKGRAIHGSDVQEGMSSGATDGMSEKEIREMLEALEGGEGEGLMGGILNELMSREVLEEPMRDLLSKVRANGSNMACSADVGVCWGLCSRHVSLRVLRRVL